MRRPFGLSEPPSDGDDRKPESVGGRDFDDRDAYLSS